MEKQKFISNVVDSMETLLQEKDSNFMDYMVEKMDGAFYEENGNYYYNDGTQVDNEKLFEAAISYKKSVNDQLNELKEKNEKAFREARFNNSIAEVENNYFVNEEGKLRNLTDSEFIRVKEQFEYIEYNLKEPKVWVDPDVELVGTTLDRLVKSNKEVL